VEASADFGPKITTFVGLGVGIITESDITAKVTGNVEIESTTKTGGSTSTVKTLTERISTSPSPDFVGHAGDVFVGNSTNIQYGLVNAVSAMKKTAVPDHADILIDNNDAEGYVIAKTQGLAFGQQFDTRFAYTEAELEEIMIPKWRDNLKILLQPVGTAPNPAIITNPVYVSKLATDDPNFGKKNTDKNAFGAQAAKADKFDDGPSYKI
jgi:hypothetical protein